MGYVVGLMATDGCLISDGRHLAFGSQDRALVELLLQCLGRSNAVRETTTRRGRPYFRVQFSDLRLYRWLLVVGLTPRKSLTLGALLVPDEFLVEVVRGLLDGDGSIMNIEYQGGGHALGHRYRTPIVRFNSASRMHLEWIQRRLSRMFGIHGAIASVLTPDKNPFFHLNYGKRESLLLLSALYADPSAPCLVRKREKWERSLALEASNGAAPTRASGSAT